MSHGNTGMECQTAVLRQVNDALKLKQIESQCLADLCRQQMRAIKNKDATIALLQKRLLQAKYTSNRRAA